MSDQTNGQQGTPTTQGNTSQTNMPPRRPANNRPATTRSSGLPNPNKPVQNPKKKTESPPVPIQRLTPADNTNTAVSQTTQEIVDGTANQKPKKKGKVGLIVGAVAVVGVIGAGVALKGRNKEPVEPVIETYVVSTQYEDSGRYAIDNYISALNSGDVNAIASQSVNSWVAQEWKYANNNVVHENWIKSALAYVSVDYPIIQSVNNLGELAYDDSGSPLMELSPLLSGESVTLSVVDYDTLSSTMREDIQMITEKYKESGYSPDDYLYQSEMTDLMLDYLLSKSNFPTKQYSVQVKIVDSPTETPTVTTEIETVPDENYVPVTPQSNVGDGFIMLLANDLDGLTGGSSDGLTAGDVDGLTAGDTNTTVADGASTPPSSDTTPSEATSSDLIIEIMRGTEGYYVVANDSAFDTLVFGSDDYRKMLDTYGSLIYEYEYSIEDANITEQKEKHDALVKAADDKLKELQDEYILKQLGEEPDEEALKELKETMKEMTWEDLAEALDITDEEELKAIEKVMTVPEWEEPERKFSPTYVSESVIPYTWSGAYYAQTEYKGTSNTNAQTGDGTFDKPAGIGTTVLTKAYCADGKFHDVKVTLMTYKIGEDAVKYAIGYSEKNRGFDATSQVKLICYEIKIENLENEPIKLKSDMFLSDAYSNQSARTGDMYGFFSEAEIPAHESVVLNDWATSTEMKQKYVCWGKSFNRQHPVVWFKLLAGSGNEVPPYNAQESYVNKSDIPEPTTEQETEPDIIDTLDDTVSE